MDCWFVSFEVIFVTLDRAETFHWRSCQLPQTNCLAPLVIWPFLLPPLTHTCAPLTTPVRLHTAGIESSAAVSPVNKQTRVHRVSSPSHNSLWLTHHYSWGRFLEVLEVNAKLAGFSSSPRMQSVSCADVWAADTHKDVNQTIKRSEPCCCVLLTDSLDINGCWGGDRDWQCRSLRAKEIKRMNSLKE